MKYPTGKNSFSSNILIFFDAVSISGYSLFQYSSILLGLEFVIHVLYIFRYPIIESVIHGTKLKTNIIIL